MPVIGLLHPKPSPTMTGGRGSLLLIHACLGLHNWRNPESISLCICEVDPISFESAAGSRRKFPPGQQRVAKFRSNGRGQCVRGVCPVMVPCTPWDFAPQRRNASLRYPSDASLGPGGGKRQAQGMEPMTHGFNSRPSTLDPFLLAAGAAPNAPARNCETRSPPRIFRSDRKAGTRQT